MQVGFLCFKRIKGSQFIRSISGGTRDIIREVKRRFKDVFGFELVELPPKESSKPAPSSAKKEEK